MSAKLSTTPGSGRPDDGSSATPERVLDAAEELFARRGYAATSVRDITTAAGSNLAAVNYYFGSKHNLYRETMQRRLKAIRCQRLAALETVESCRGREGALAPTLRAFAEAFLAPIREARPEGPPLLLLMREVVDPQLPRDLFETELVLPVQRALISAITATAPRLDERTVQLSAQSFIAQLVHVLHAHRFAPGGDDGAVDAFELTELVDHVVRFTIAAIDRLQEART